jgi:hypothetical protein
MPSGVAGLSWWGFAGWFPEKAAAEPMGMSWAWLIHFLQDVVIVTAAVLFLASA